MKQDGSHTDSRMMQEKTGYQMDPERGKAGDDDVPFRNIFWVVSAFLLSARFLGFGGLILKALF